MRPNIEMQLFYAYVQGINHVTVQRQAGVNHRTFRLC